MSQLSFSRILRFLNAERTVTIYNASINRFCFEQGHLKLVQWGQIEHLSDDIMDELN